MKEIGGYIEFERNHMPLLHDGAVALNSGTSCLAYLIRAKKIRKLVIPYFLCDCIEKVCQLEGVQVRRYFIHSDFTPDRELIVQEDEWLYVVNYYGQLTISQIQELEARYSRIIVDNAQAYFAMPVDGVDTLYTCRKFFGVPDGAFLYTGARFDEELPRDESFERMRFLLGRFEQPASEFYGEYVANNDLLSKEPIKRMSRLTDNLLRGIDYEKVKRIRTDNYRYLSQCLGERNLLKLRDVEGAFAYPLYLENGSELRKALLCEKIYIPTLWPNVLTLDGTLEKTFAENILPLPCDQRYSLEDMETIIQQLR